MTIVPRIGGNKSNLIRVFIAHLRCLQIKNAIFDCQQFSQHDGFKSGGKKLGSCLPVSIFSLFYNLLNEIFV